MKLLQGVAGSDKTGKRLLKQLIKQVDALKVVLSKSENEDFRVHKGPRIVFRGGLFNNLYALVVIQIFARYIWYIYQQYKHT